MKKYPCEMVQVGGLMSHNYFGIAIKKGIIFLSLFAKLNRSLHKRKRGWYLSSTTVVQIHSKTIGNYKLGSTLKIIQDE